MTVLMTIGPANDVLPTRSWNALMTFDELQFSGFQTAIGDANSRFSWPMAMASTA